MIPVPLPKITNQQAFLLEHIIRSGEAMASTLSAQIEISGPAFYQMMGRLIKTGLVTSRKDQHIIAGQIIRETRYTATPQGRKELLQTFRYYAARVAAYDHARR